MCIALLFEVNLCGVCFCGSFRLKNLQRIKKDVESSTWQIIVFVELRGI